MKKILLPILLIIIFTSITFGQFTIEGNVSFPSEEYRADVMDSSNYNIYYQYISTKNTEHPDNKHQALTMLQVGNNYAKFTDFNTLRIDSTLEHFSHLDKIGSDEINQLLRIKKEIGFTSNIIRDINKNTITFQSRTASQNFEYEIVAPDLKWELNNENKTLLNYAVKKATIIYKGRKWIAWYSEDIPINFGPYYFSGLPGLILELYDDPENFHFTTIGLDIKKMAIYKKNERNIVRTSREKFIKAEKNYHKHPELYINGIYNSNGDDDNVEYPDIPYNPIELE